MAKFDVDFPHVRENADIVAVMAHYNVTLNGDGDQRKGPCPLHSDTRNSLSVNTAKNVFRCHSCGSSGNVIKFVQLVDDERSNPRRAALQIAKLSEIPPKPGGEIESRAAVVKTEAAQAASVEDDDEAVGEADADGVSSNRPLTFKLQLTELRAGGESVANRFVEALGLNYDRLAELGIRMSERGSMKGRLAIPIHNTNGELVAYCGRAVGRLEDADGEAYKFPPKFDRELELYGWHQAQDFNQIILVEDVMTVIKHADAAADYGQHGYGMAALMNGCISDAQIELLIQNKPRVVVCMSGDVNREVQGMSFAPYLASAGLWVTIRSCDWKLPETVDSEAFCRACCVE